MRHHTARLTLDTITELILEVQEHTPFPASLDLSPCDFHMFGSLKEALGDQIFNNKDEVEKFVRTWLSGLLKRWTKCVTSEG